MISCPYCATELILDTDRNTHCDFCDIELGPNSEIGMYAVDGKRIEKRKRVTYLAAETVKLPLKQLCELHPLDVIMCLKEARSERANIFSVMRIFNKADGDKIPNEKKLEEYRLLAEETGNEYEYWTRKCWTIENLLIDRIGYFPEKINKEFLASFIAKNEKSLLKPMKISKANKLEKGLSNNEKK
ncbi:hypothetical protein P4562_21185 [Lysinibacillus xylanilyticus]|uniref:hypothetical protein n=1 Tax=Lysinibacillus xylanilyticus TaxID=582475 RepID=UPI002E240668|nr:hypothetical protein [Lysinibacillus xylanilyticus]